MLERAESKSESKSKSKSKSSSLKPFSFFQSKWGYLSIKDFLGEYDTVVLYLKTNKKLREYLLEKYKNNVKEWPEILHSTQMNWPFIHNTAFCYEVRGDFVKYNSVVKGSSKIKMSLGEINFDFKASPFRIRRITATNAHDCYLSTKGNVFLVKKNKLSQSKKLALSEITDIASSLDTLYLTSKNAVFKISDRNLSDSTLSFAQQVETINLKDIVQVAPGKDHTLFLNRDGIIYGCGNKTQGRLGTTSLDILSSPMEIKGSETNKLPKFKKIAVGATHSLALSEDGDVYACETDNTIPLRMQQQVNFVKIDRLSKIKDIAAWDAESAFIDENDQLFVVRWASLRNAGIQSEPRRIVDGLYRIMHMAFAEYNNWVVLFLLVEQENNLYLCEYLGESMAIFKKQIPLLSPAMRFKLDEDCAEVIDAFSSKEILSKFPEIKMLIKRLSDEPLYKKRLLLIETIKKHVKSQFANYLVRGVDIEATPRLILSVEKFLAVFPQYKEEFEEVLSSLKNEIEKLNPKGSSAPGLSRSGIY